MSRDVSPNVTNTVMAVVIAILCFFLWRVVLAPFDNPMPPEITPGPTGKAAPLPKEGLPPPGHVRFVSPIRR